MSEFKEILPWHRKRNKYGERIYCHIRDLDEDELVVCHQDGYLLIYPEEEKFYRRVLDVEKAKIVRDALNEFLKEPASAQAKEGV